MLHANNNPIVVAGAPAQNPAELFVPEKDAPKKGAKEKEKDAKLAKPAGKDRSAKSAAIFVPQWTLRIYGQVSFKVLAPKRLPNDDCAGEDHVYGGQSAGR